MSESESKFYSGRSREARTQLCERSKSVHGMDKNELVSCASGQSVLGVLCVSKGGLFLNFVEPNSDSTFWWGMEEEEEVLVLEGTSWYLSLMASLPLEISVLIIMA